VTAKRRDDEELFGRVGRWVDARLRVSNFARTALDKVFPDNWSFMLGEVAMYCFVILVLTGVYLTFFFTPSAREVVYQGSYHPLQGVRMSEAYESTIRLSFDVRAGLVFRQIHHWAALLFLAAIVTHLCRVFFTGAFRRPREVNWLVGVTLLVLALINGFAGYSLPDDLLSGTGLRIAYSIVLAIPLAGTWLAFMIFGGNFPSETIITRLFVIHILLVPAAIAVLLSAHLAILWRQKHTQFRGPGRTEGNVVGSYLWPTYAARSIGLLAAIFAVLSALGGLAQINPVWLYGPYKPYAVSTAAQPDWYMGWLEGALRLLPGWRIHLWGFRLSELFWPGIVLPGLTFTLLYVWPFMEQRFTRDRAEHHLLDQPRHRPVRTSIGVGVLTFYIVLFLAGSQDVLAQHLGLSIPAVTYSLRVLIFVLPLLAAFLAWRLCHDLAASERHVRGEPPSPPESALASREPASGEPASGEPARVGEQRRWWLRRIASALAVGVATLFGFVAGRRKRTETIYIEEKHRS
jgi:ubiquinol-cytochrome c reductase cytochrome b subunit